MCKKLDWIKPLARQATDKAWRVTTDSEFAAHYLGHSGLEIVLTLLKPHWTAAAPGHPDHQAPSGHRSHQHGWCQ